MSHGHCMHGVWSKNNIQYTQCTADSAPVLTMPVPALLSFLSLSSLLTARVTSLQLQTGRGGFPDIFSRLRRIQAEFTARDDPHHGPHPPPYPAYSPPAQTSPPPVFMFDNKTSMDMDKSGYLLTLLLLGKNFTLQPPTVT